MVESNHAGPDMEPDPQGAEGGEKARHSGFVPREADEAPTATLNGRPSRWPSMPPDPHTPVHSQAAFTALTVAAIGIVYGDIGTSPLYALKECLSPHYGLTVSEDTVLGLLSLMTWSLTMVVTVKYLVFITRATNRGEGGILALLALVPERLRIAKPGRIRPITLLVIFGAALLYGDGMITPAISVLSAVEGLGLATSALQPWVISLSCAILIGLFAVQRFGTARVGILFGPVMVLWFLVLGLLGLYHIAHNPWVLLALSPHYGVMFLVQHGFKGFAVLGSVVLCVTGGEALYADMGHFGIKPIQHAWYRLVMPSLLLAYFGQGANVLLHPEAAANPFYAMVPVGSAMLALVGLATLAAVIASQALISGAYSLTNQAVQLGLFPRVTITHTSFQTEGQIYLPEINWALAVSCVALVLNFKTSDGLAAAYGIAVCGTMAITSVLFVLVARDRWSWPISTCLGVLGLFMIFDLGFLSANLLKFSHGGSVPVFIAVGISLMMIAWPVGRGNLSEYYRKRAQSWEVFTERLKEERILRPDAVGVFMASDAHGVPVMMLHQAERIRAVPANALLMTVRIEHVPMVPSGKRLVEVTDLGNGFHRVIASYGFMQIPEVPRVIEQVVQQLGLRTTPREITYYLGRESVVHGKRGSMNKLLQPIFRVLVRNALPATAYFRLPAEQVVELGLQIDL